ncbi:hypothetical protein TanjilG_19705 [Lupinus angustifolius]|uniref:VQ domain-containing protein n=1 Tax=Lupinus angustifolius TaxID=3871 RepID=A0A4P1RAP1_LUPAN|nr:PREDICTED: uncharacterized protein LOC109353937 [Lupinus angustifolius]OIW06267.1 hypothetical protein TanjilG_19705 [Lupinus angustifolius]
MSSSDGLHGAAPKVVQIETRYVQTDAVNFKDVVQSFTGKNSSTAWIGQRNSNNNVDQLYDVVMGSSLKIKGGTAVFTSKAEEVGTAATFPSMLMKNMAFKDFDTLLLELPSMEMENMPWF